jgi:tetratricopeptide (TPR) repeat protein
MLSLSKPNLRVSAKLIPVALLAALFAVSWACGRDPASVKRAHVAAGDKYFISGKLDYAVIEFRKALETDPSFAEAHVKLGRAYRAMRDLDRAYKEFETAAKEDPGSMDFQLWLAEALTDRGDYKGVDAILRKILDVDQKNVQAHAILGRRYLAAGDLPKAISELEEVVGLDPLHSASYAVLASALLAGGRFDDAAAAFEKAVAVAPRSSSAHLELGQFYFHNGNAAGAEREVKAAISLDSDAILPRLVLAGMFLSQGRLSESESLYKQLKRFSSDERAYHALLSFYAATGQHASAIAEARRILGEKPKDLPARTLLIEALIDLHRLPEADSELDSALKSNPTDVRLLIARGRTLIARRDYPNAISVLKEAVGIVPGSPVAHYLLGAAQNAAGFPAAARTSLGKAAELAPEMSEVKVALASASLAGQDEAGALAAANDALASNRQLLSGYVFRARALIAKGDLQGARATLLNALNADPYYLPALSAWINVAARQGTLDEARQRITSLISRQADSAPSHFLLGVVEFSSRNVDKAQAEARRAIELDPQLPNVYSLLANIDFVKGNPEAGKADLSKAIKMNPRTLSNYMALGTQYEKENNWEEARKTFEAARDLAPTEPMILAELAYIYLDHGGDASAALSLARAARERLPGSGVTADALGWAYYKTGLAEAALVELKKAVDTAGENPMYRYHLAKAYISTGQPEKGARALEAALHQDPSFPFAANAKAALDELNRNAR